MEDPDETLFRGELIGARRAGLAQAAAYVRRSEFFGATRVPEADREALAREIEMLGRRVPLPPRPPRNRP